MATRKRPRPGAARPMVPIWSPVVGAHRVNAAEGYTGTADGSVSRSKRANRPVTMPCDRSHRRAGSNWGRSLAGPTGGAELGRGPHRECCVCSIRPTSTSARATPTWAIEPDPARAAVRGIRGNHRPGPRGEGRPGADRRRPVHSNVQPKRSVERAAAELEPGGCADPDRHRAGHPRRLRQRVDLPRLRHGGARGRGRLGYSSRCWTRTMSTST